MRQQPNTTSTIPTLNVNPILKPLTERRNWSFTKSITETIKTLNNATTNEEILNAQKRETRARNSFLNQIESSAVTLENTPRRYKYEILPQLIELITLIETQQELYKAAQIKLDTQTQTVNETMLEAIRNHPKIANVYSRNGSLYITTTELYTAAQPQCQPWPHGPYVIRIRAATANPIPQIRIVNENQEQHWFTPNGRSKRCTDICVGSWADLYVRAVQDKDWLTYIDIVIQQLESTNDHNGYSRVQNVLETMFQKKYRDKTLKIAGKTWLVNYITMQENTTPFGINLAPEGSTRAPNEIEKLLIPQPPIHKNTNGVYFYPMAVIKSYDVAYGDRRGMDYYVPLQAIINLID